MEGISDNDWEKTYFEVRDRSIFSVLKNIHTRIVIDRPDGKLNHQRVGVRMVFEGLIRSIESMENGRSLTFEDYKRINYSSFRLAVFGVYEAERRFGIKV